MTVFAIIAHTQVLENYGTEDAPYWKPKFGSAYWVGNINAEDARTAKQLSSGIPYAEKIETRNSTMLIEYTRQIEAILIEDAERRSKINRDDPNIDPDTFFEFVERVEPLRTYTAN